MIKKAPMPEILAIVAVNTRKESLAMR
jgi:hypothetical protein